MKLPVVTQGDGGSAASSTPPPAPLLMPVPAPDRADLRPENIQDAVIRFAGNSQDGIQTAGAFLARLAGRSDHDVMTYMTIPATIFGWAVDLPGSDRFGRKYYQPAMKQIFSSHFISTVTRTTSIFCAKAACCFTIPTYVEPNLDDKRFVYVGVPITGLTVEALGRHRQRQRQNIVVLV